MQTNKIKNILRIVSKIILWFFALVGLLFTSVFVAMKLHITDVKGSIDSRNNFFNNIRENTDRNNLNKLNRAKWLDSTEFDIFKEGILKDKELILKISEETGISSRLIVASVLPEQLRFFTSNRESFKKYFEPLKILGNYTQFSYGISGIKMETAKMIENNLKDRESNFYLGSSFENILDYNPQVIDVDSERLSRFTDSHDHYYSYLYTALYLKQIMRQWEVSGYDIKDRPEVLATLFNLGFYRSLPKDNPEVGGATITIDNNDYTFGGLAYDFYYSDELRDIFPFDVK